MTGIFIAHSTMDAACAEQVRRDVQAKGYTTWQPATSLQMSEVLSPRTMQTVILGSAAFILLWSHSVAQSEHVEHYLLFAQRLRKPILPILLGNEPLPSTLLATAPLTAQTPCTEVVPLLLQQGLLPAPRSTDALVTLWEHAAHDLVRERKEAIDQAADMLVHHAHREAVLALLEYLAHNDLMNGVREKAQEAIEADTKRQMPPSAPSPFMPQDSRHLFGVRCKNGHITYFDKRQVCRIPKSHLHRVVQRANVEFDELDLECKTCHEPVTVRVDCEGYR